MVMSDEQMKAFEAQAPWYRQQQARARAEVANWEALTGMPMAEYLALPVDERLKVATAAAKKAKRGAG